MLLTIKDYVKVTKIDASANATFRSAKMEEWIAGAMNDGLGLPMEYVVKGIIIKSPVVGERFEFYRTERMGVEALGVFTTSVVKQIDDTEDHILVHTENSTYKVEKIDADEKEKN